MGLPLVTTKSETISHEVIAVKPVSETAVQNPHPPAITSTPSTSAEPASLTASSPSSKTISEIDVKVHHRFSFKPLGTTVNMHSTLVIFSDEASGLIVRIQDRPMEAIPSNSLITVSLEYGYQHVFIGRRLIGSGNLEDAAQDERRGGAKVARFTALIRKRGSRQIRFSSRIGVGRGSSRVLPSRMIPF